MAQMQNCESCGATIYPEHVDQGRAGRWAGKLLCAVCYAEKRSDPGSSGGEKAKTVELAAAPARDAARAAPPGPPAPVVAAEPVPVGDEPISLVETSEDASGPSRIQNLGQRLTTVQHRKQLTRQTAVTGHGACRVKTFHSKIAVESIEFMDDAINEWLDENPGVEVKFVTTTIGMMAGKHPEPNLILNLWY